MAATAPATKPRPKRRPARPVAAVRAASPATRPSPAPIPGSRIPVAVSRTAGAVGQIPDLGIVQRMARGRAWILVLGLLLTGIVAINVVTLSLTASTGKMEQRATALEQQNSALEASLARQLSNDRVEAAALGLGMVRPAAADYTYLTASTGSAALAAERAAAAVEVSDPSGTTATGVTTAVEGGVADGTAETVSPATAPDDATSGVGAASVEAAPESSAPIEPVPPPSSESATGPVDPGPAPVEGGVAANSAATGG